MHFFIAGGSGQTGTHVINKLIQQGHTVTALVRNPSSITPRVGVKLVQGTPSNIDDIRKALQTPRTPDVIIITLAHVKGAVFDDRGTTFLTYVARNIAQCLEESQMMTTKIIYMSAFGVGDSFPNLNCLMRVLVRVSPLASQFSDHKGAEDTLQSIATDADGRKAVVTIVRPTMLTNGEEAKVQSLGSRGEKASFMPSIPRASVADFMVDAAQIDKCDGKVVVIANAKSTLVDIIPYSWYNT
ncbi:conserved hypothetical protein [Talaromyces stipitatus ATCC 10500]|uniref:NAD(P)-binding domain-containing protein n=1 Tax=Talaromyces stipitatus (strain ATCC 10500 / CBS 375.48 / QM 6759 / NRRL 1006) TaxID=441959 RepID=B8MIG4_TALSN|nr:uncharacterized protein TSTA_041260 [Talaromyces stipitatus ATCC 10500]EED14648.1 conserved hypothetical protein [Talaromyces stipitatus ATCC 10500]